MNPGAPTPQQIALFQQVFDALFDLLHWTYGVVLNHNDRSAIQTRILQSWALRDGTVKELLTYLGGLHSTVFSEQGSRRDRYRPQVQRLFAMMFASPDPTERGQVIALLHQTLERPRPGCTGVALPRPHVPLSQPAWPTPGPALPSGPPPAYPPASPFPYATPSAPPAYATPTPGNFPGGSVNTQHLGDVPDIQRLSMEAQIRQQKLMFDQKIWDMQHNSVMEVIRSMGR